MRNLTLPRDNGVAVKAYYRKNGLYLKSTVLFIYSLFICRCGYDVNMVVVCYISHLSP